MNFEIISYEEKYEEQWDDFVENEAINGTFLQQWKFLNYHGKDRFRDCSIMFWSKNKLVAVCPACIIVEKGKKIFYSHMGSTYGGLVVSKELLRAEKMKALIDSFENFLKEHQFNKCILKPTMSLLCVRPQDIIEFFMYFNGYRESKELNIYIDYSCYNTVDIINNFSKMKRRNTKKCLDEGMQLRQLKSYQSIKEFHRVLSKNLLKYNKTPVHTVEELMVLQERLGKNIKFYGAYLNEKLLAGTMVFLFEKTQLAHTQYLAADPDYNYLNPMTFIYYKMIEVFAQEKYHFLSWGIATEHLGRDINYNLANNKEEFGSLHCINYIYEKEFN